MHLARSLAAPLVIAVLSLGSAAAQQAAGEATITAHGVSVFDDLKLAPDFAHLAYVNPDAPKGGEISEWAAGGFDSYNP